MTVSFHATCEEDDRHQQNRYADQFGLKPLPSMVITQKSA